MRELQTITTKELLEHARRSLIEKYHTLSDALSNMEAKGRIPPESAWSEINIVSEQIDEVTDRIEVIERSIKRGGVGDMTRLKVEPKYGDWYYQKVVIENEDDEKVHKFALYEGDSYMGEFGNITAMKHYVRTGQRL